MSKRIEGITIKIGADTTELKSAIKGIDSELGKTQGQLRDVNRLLKLDPGNTELITQKQRLLSEAIKGTEEKLKTLREASEQANQALANGEITQNQYDSLQREIIQTEQDLKRLEQQAKETNDSLADPTISEKLGKVGTKLQDVGDKVSNVGKGLTKGVTAPLVAMGAASVKAFNEVDSGVDTIVAKTGASGKALEEMQRSMEGIATRIPTDFETAGAAIGEVNTRFGLTGQALEDLSEKFVKFAELNGTDVSSSIDQTQKVMEAFGVKAEDAGALLDTLNAVGQATGISMDTLTSSMVTNAASLNEMGMSASDSAYFLGNLEKSGVDTSQVMTGLKKAVVEAAKEGKTLPDVLKDFSATMQSSASDTEKLQSAIDIFGSRAGPAIYQAAKTGTLSLDELGTSLQDNLGNVDKTYEGTMDGTDKLKTTFNQLKIAGAELGGSLGDVLAPMLESLSEVIRKVAQWFQNLDPHTKELIVKMGLLAAAIGPVVFAIGKVITIVGTVMNTIGPIILLLVKVGAAIAAVATGPLVAIVAAVAGAIAIGVLLYKNWDTVKEKAKSIWEGIKSVVGGAVEKIKGFAQGIIDAFAFIPEWWSTMWEGVKNTFALAMQGIQLVLQTIIGLFQAIPEKWTALWDGIRGVFEAFWTALMENPIVQLFLQLILDEISIFSETLSGLWENIKTIAGTAWELIKLAILGPVGLLISLVTGDFDGLKDGLKKNWEKTKELADQLWGEVKDLITDFAKDILGGVKRTFENLKHNLEGVWGNIKTGVYNAWQNIKSTVSTTAENARSSAVTAFTNMKAGIGTALSGMYYKITGAFQSSIDWLKGLGSSAWNWGYDMMVNFANGIANGVTWVWDEVMDLVNWIEDWIGFSEPDKGPLSRFHTYGPDMMKLLASGIRDNAYLVKDAIGDVSGLIAGDVSGATSNNYNYGPMSINVYGAQGQDVRELARVVEENINTRMKRQGAVFG